MDLVRLRMNRCQSAVVHVKPTSHRTAGRRPKSSQPLGACAKSRQTPASPLPLVTHSGLHDYGKGRTSQIEYLTIGRSLKPRDTVLTHRHHTDTVLTHRPRQDTVLAHRPRTSVSRPPDIIPSRHLVRSPPDRSDHRAAGSGQSRGTGGPAARQRNGTRPPVSLKVTLSIDDLDVTQPDLYESWSSAHDQKTLSAYGAILRDQSRVLSQLTAKLGIGGVEFTKISPGGLVVHAGLRDLDAVDKIRDLQASGKLKRAFNDCVVSEELLTDAGVDGIVLGTHIQPEELRRCHQELGVRTRGVHLDIGKEQKQQQPTANNDGDKWSGAPVFVSRSQCVDKINSIQKTLEAGVDQVRKSYSAFASADLDDFLTALKLTKPTDIDKVTCLNDVIKCYDFLKNSASVGRNVNMESVRTFLSVVNLLRVAVIDVKTTLSKVRGHVAKYTGAGVVEETLEVCVKLGAQYDPLYPFSELEESSEEESGLSVLDRQLFSGLVSYTPWLLGQTSHLHASLERVRRRLTFDEAADGEGVISIQFRRISAKT